MYIARFLIKIRRFLFVGYQSFNKYDNVVESSEIKGSTKEEFNPKVGIKASTKKEYKPKVWIKESAKEEFKPKVWIKGSTNGRI